MDYQRIIEDLEDIEIAGDALRVVEAMEKISQALVNSRTLEQMLSKITDIVSDLEEDE